MISTHESIFKKASSTYYFASLLFPKKIRQNISILYAYVRTADNFIDQVPQDTKGFYTFVKKTHASWKGDIQEDPIIDDFVSLAKKHAISKKWVFDFLSAMESDITKKNYKTYEELQKYMYGSAEVIGLMMCKIMNIGEEAYPYAKKLGESMQLFNFIRDIQEDLSLGRVYLPKEDLEKYKITNLDKEIVNKGQFTKLIRYEIHRYRKLRIAAEPGYQFIEKKNQLPIRLASELYAWAANEIYKNPMIIFDKKVKPKKSTALVVAMSQFMKISFPKQMLWQKI